MKIKNLNKPLLILTILSLCYLIISLGFSKFEGLTLAGYYLYYIIVLFFIINIIKNFIGSKYDFKNNLLDVFFFILFIIVLIFDKVLDPFFDYDIKIVFVCGITIRNFLFFYKTSSDEKNVVFFSKKAIFQPAKSLIISYIFLIFTGTFLLLLPISVVSPKKLGFINALFTATSAVSVTGLTVFDTGSDFTLFGQIVVLLLIQFGALGIMIFSYFAAFITGRKISFEERLNISFMINENDMKNIYRNIKNIILITFFSEFAGALILFIRFSFSYGLCFKSFFHSLFHSISAFCNAGFALYSDSMIGFKSDVFVNLTICFLIILGGLSFSVITNVYENLRNFINIRILKKRNAFTKLSLNTIVVLSITSILIFTGTLLFYGFEHGNILLKENIFTQYLASFFQSITLRTAGFNTLDISNLNGYTYFFMIIFMFIGGASGSTAGGVKVNSVGVIFAYFRSFLNNSVETTLLKKSISHETITKSFLAVTLGGVLIFLATIILSASEKFSTTQILFEIVSAFGTVGLSTGITPNLSYLGKIVIIILMFVGKVGPLTILASVSKKAENSSIKYPEATITIG